MKTLLSLVGLVALTSAPAFAQAGAVKAGVFTSQSKLKIKGMETRTAGVTIGREFSKEEQDGHKQNALGAGAAVEWNISNPVRLGTGVNYISFDGDDTHAGYRDLGANLYSAFDLFSTESGALYGSLGASYHRLSLENITSGGMTADAKGTDLGNYDVGLGARFKLNYATNLGLEYRYSQTFARNDVDLKLKGAGLASEGMKYTDVGLQNNEVQATVGFLF